MWQIDTDIFLQFPTESRMRILHAGKVAEAQTNRLTIAFNEADLLLEPGEEVMLYFNVGRSFHKQPAKVMAVTLNANRPIAVIDALGESIPAESRQCYRTLTVVRNLMVKIGDEQECPLLDASATGFAAISTQLHSIGTLADITLIHDNHIYRGKACVQSVCDLGPGRTRYGFHAIADRNVSNDLLKGLQQVSMAVQRQQLRRRAGIA